MSGGRPDPSEPPLERPPRQPPRRAESLVIVNTGDGKGKSTAAFGVVMRAVARDWPVSVIQFLKSDKWQVGEEDVARRLGVEWARTGDGFSWLSDDLERSQALAAAAWELAASTLEAGAHRLVVLDEITYPMSWGWIATEDVVRAIAGRPEQVNVIATGRHAPPALVEVADNVTEMVKVRHAFDRGVPAMRGIDF
jgi:cob(I)alamin adenosyltransferase